MSCLTIRAKRVFRRRWIRLVLVMEKMKPRRPEEMTLVEETLFDFDFKHLIHLLDNGNTEKPEDILCEALPIACDHRTDDVTGEEGL